MLAETRPPPFARRALQGDLISGISAPEWASRREGLAGRQVAGLWSMSAASWKPVRHHDRMLKLLIGLLLALALPLPLAARAAEALDCRALRQQRDAIAAEAMQAEIALVQELRRRLCPELEAVAEQAHAGAAAGGQVTVGSGSPTSGPAAAASVQTPGAVAVQTAPVELDYGVYIGCRRQAEQQLQRTRVVLHRNLQGFSFYTLDGARLARQADALQSRFAALCDTAGAAGASP